MKAPYLFLLIALVFSTCVSVGSGEEDTTLHIHVVPFTHLDPGWWWSFETYYTKWVDGIITTMVNVLDEKPERKFIFAEMSFFSRWWKDQNPQMREKVMKLVNNKQFEFVYGGWVMNDEASTHYSDIINQIELGTSWLIDNLDFRPNVSFANDPFGHQSTMPYIFKKAGYHAMLINRIHKDDKNARRQGRALEFLWRQDWDQPYSHNSILAHALPYKLYDIPNTCGPSYTICRQFDFETKEAIPIIDSNVAERSELLLQQYKIQAPFFRHNHLLIILGDDFKYKTPEITYPVIENYERIFAHINANTEDLKADIKWSTLSEYFDAVASATGATSNGVQLETAGKKFEGFPNFDGDFFTYNDEEDDYWSGYFTTRPKVKQAVRRSSHLLRHAEQLLATSVLKKQIDQEARSEFYDSLQTARGSVALAQHHDAITGTGRKEVVDDYLERLRDGNQKSLGVMQHIIADLATNEKTESKPNPHLRFTLDAGTVDLTQVQEASLVFHNSLTVDQHRIAHLKLHSGTNQVRIFSNTDEEQPDVELQVQRGSESEREDGLFDVYFLASVPALGYRTYTIQLKDKSVEKPDYVTTPTKLGIDSTDLIKLKNDQIFLTFNAKGEPISFGEKGDEEGHRFEHKFSRYQSTSKGGAYIFKPAGARHDLENGAESVLVVRGPLFESLQVQLSNLVKVRYTVYKVGDLQGLVEIAQDIDISSQSNLELFSTFALDIKDDGKPKHFTTDTNGFGQRKRERTDANPLPANVFPISTGLFIEDNEKRVTFLTDQAMGATVGKDGRVELCLDRRLDQDDGRGMGEAVGDNVQMTINLWAAITKAHSIHEAPAITGLASSLVNYPPLLFVGVKKNPDAKNPITVPELSLLPSHTPFGSKDIHLETLRLRYPKSDELVARVMHLGAHEEKATTNLQGMLANPTQVREMTINLAYDAQKEFTRTIYKSASLDTGRTLKDTDPIPEVDLAHITLSPMDIRTFVVSHDASTVTKVPTPTQGSRKKDILDVHRRSPDGGHVHGPITSKDLVGDIYSLRQGNEASNAECLAYKTQALKAAEEKMRLLDQIQRHQSEAERWRTAAHLAQKEVFKLKGASVFGWGDQYLVIGFIVIGVAVMGMMAVFRLAMPKMVTNLCKCGGGERSALPKRKEKADV